MQHADYAALSARTNDRLGIVLGIAGVDDDWLPHFFGQRDLSRERGQLRFSRGVVVVIVEPTFADSYGGAG
jgi:hypothetical protein